MLNNTAKELDTTEIISTLWKRRIWIAATAFIAALCTFLLVYFSPDQYASSGVLYVSNKDVALEADPTLSVKTSDINASRSLVTSYLEILKTTDFLQKVCDDLDNRFTPVQIEKTLSMKTLNETEFLHIRAVTADPQTSFEIVSVVMNNAPETLTYVFESGSTKVVDTPKVSRKPIGKNLIKKTVIGFLAGAFAASILILVVSFFDTKIHKSSDLVKRYKLSVLGEIKR